MKLHLIVASLLLSSLYAGEPDKPEKKDDAKPDPVLEEKLEKARMDARIAIIEALLSEAKAGEYLSLADGLKSKERFDEAAVFYLIAQQADPKLSMANYQLACNFALWGQPKPAMEQLKRAVDKGFWGVEMMKTDDDLDSIRKEPGFDDLQNKVAELYKVEGPKHAGTPIEKMPKGNAPEGGWPVMVLMHGFGTSASDFEEVAQVASEHGFVGLAIPGTVVHYIDRFAWPSASCDETHTYIQTLLEKYKDRKDVNLKKVFVGGFSQGAWQACYLTAEYPNAYAGAFALSPGNVGKKAFVLAKSDTPRPLFMMYGKAEMVGNVMMARLFAETWEKSNWPVKLTDHPGAHHFPKDWKETFGKAFEWLKDPKEQK